MLAPVTVLVGWLVVVLGDTVRVTESATACGAIPATASGATPATARGATHATASDAIPATGSRRLEAIELGNPNTTAVAVPPPARWWRRPHSAARTNDIRRAPWEA